jgi:hypothetical protein
MWSIRFPMAHAMGWHLSPLWGFTADGALCHREIYDLHLLGDYRSFTHHLCDTLYLLRGTLQ